MKHLDAIIKAVISFLVTGGLGYCISTIKGYKKKLKEKNEESKLMKEALMMMLQNTLTATYYVYEKIGEIPDYVYKNWLNSLDIYEKLNGNDYIHILAEKMKHWKIVKTDILK